MGLTRPAVALSDGELSRLRGLLEAGAGLRFEESRRDTLDAAVGHRMVRSGVATVGEYLDALAGARELQELLDDVTIPETHFFRNPPQVDALAAHVLPGLLRHALATTGRVRIWSAGCSTGEEPYTVAMLLLEAMDTVPGARRLDVSVVGTDISCRVLAAAERAEYGARSVAMATPARLARFFVADGGGWRVRPEVQALVTWSRHNLAGDLPPFVRGERLDLVLCRNVTIYFDRETTRALMGRLHSSLRDGGFLFLGHSETLWRLSDDFRLVTFGDAFVYRRDDGPDLTGAAAVGDRRRSPPRFGDLLRRLSAGAESAPPPVPPRDDPTPLALGHLALVDGRYRDAVDLADQALRLEPMSSHAHYLRGHALLVLGADSAALGALRAATYADPGHGLAWFLLAGTLSRLGQEQAARLAYAEAASHLGGRAGDAEAAELGGRPVSELAGLCRSLAQAP